MSNISAGRVPFELSAFESRITAAGIDVGDAALQYINDLVEYEDQVPGVIRDTPWLFEIDLRAIIYIINLREESNYESDVYDDEEEEEDDDYSAILAEEVKPAEDEEYASGSGCGCCPICLTNLVKYAINCGHLFCAACVNKLTDCPMCRKKKTSIRRIYLQNNEDVGAGDIGKLEPNGPARPNPTLTPIRYLPILEICG